MLRDDVLLLLTEAEGYLSGEEMREKLGVSRAAVSQAVLVNLVANAMPFRKGIAITCDSHAVINDKKVTDHHAVIPTRNLKDADLSAQIGRAHV